MRCARRSHNVIMRVSRNEIRHNPASLGGVFERCRPVRLRFPGEVTDSGEIYGTEPTARALDDALAFEAFSCEYVANLLESRARALPEPGALHLTRRTDLLELELEEPDLELYDREPTAQR